MHYTGVLATHDKPNAQIQRLEVKRSFIAEIAYNF